MDIYFIRHTRTRIEPGICYGQSEIELADSFEQECDLLRSALPDSFDQVFTSPLSRCTRLAENLGEDPKFDSRLLEYHFGDWELQPWGQIDTDLLDAWTHDFVNQRPPGGETLVELSARVSNFIEELRDQKKQCALVVTHVGVMRCVWSLLLQIPLRQLFKLEVGFGAPLHVRLERDPDYDQLFTFSQNALAD